MATAGKGGQKSPIGKKQPAKLDLYKEHKAEYVAPKQPVLVGVKPAKYLAVAGKGKPGSPEFQADIGALYGAAFTIKMTRKFAGQDYRVCHLEGIYWSSETTSDISKFPVESLNWTLLIRVPDFIKQADLTAARKLLEARGKGAAADKVELQALKEGTCVQMLHVGPYDRECDTIRRMMEFATENSLALTGRHHEIYLSDPRRVAPTKLRTILRHPVSRAA
jgi:hypothetical protein